MAFYLIQPKLFSNSMLAVLNGRTRFRTDGIVGSPSLPFEAAKPKNPHEADHRNVRPLEVHISSVSEVHNDTDEISFKQKADSEAGSSSTP
ncbi:hypothetical protein C8R44DRAFT_818292 [Mycena epipterygia]|nr:hypothetical protein C8R44DRAFT_818292 [Mycena epipterygia]